MARIRDSSVRDVVAAADMVEVVSGADAAASRLRVALHGTVPFPRGEDAVVLGEPRREALLLLRLREGRRRHLVRARDGESRLRRRRRVARRALPRADRGTRRRSPRIEASVADESAFTPCSTRRRRTSSGCSGTAMRACRCVNTSPERGLGEDIAKEFRLGLAPGKGLVEKATGARLHARRAQVRRPRHYPRDGLLPAAADVPARRRARSGTRLPGEEAERRRSSPRQVRELARGRPLPQGVDPVRPPPREAGDLQAGLRGGRRGEYRRHRTSPGGVRAGSGVHGNGAHGAAAA